MHAVPVLVWAPVPHLDASGGKSKTDNKRLVKLTDTVIVEKHEGVRRHRSRMAGWP